MKNTTSTIALFLVFFVFSTGFVAAASEEISISDETFDCIRDMTAVRGFYVDNLLNDLDGTLAAA